MRMPRIESDSKRTLGVGAADRREEAEECQEDAEGADGADSAAESGDRGQALATYTVALESVSEALDGLRNHARAGRTGCAHGSVARLAPH